LGVGGLGASSNAGFPTFSPKNASITKTTTMNPSNYLRKIAFLSMFIILCSFINLPVPATIEGKVFDESHKPLPNVEVRNLTNNFVTVSDVEGNFTLKGEINDVLRLYYPGKLTKEIKATRVTKLDIQFDKVKKVVEPPQRKIHKRAARRVKKQAPAKVDHKKHATPYSNAVTGQVSDATGPIPGANVIIKGTSKGTQTNIDGFYGIDAKIGDILIFSFVGMRETEVKVTDPVINVQLEDGVTLSEVVVTNALAGKVSGLSVGVASERIVMRGSRSVSSEVAMAATKTVGYKEASSKDKMKTDDSGREIKAGQLTAGEVNDFSKWAYWEGIAQETLGEFQKVWQIAPQFRYSVILSNKDGFPVTNRIVHLVDSANDKLWTARTDNTGRAELWYRPEQTERKDISEKLHIIDDANKIIAGNPKEFHKGINTFTYDAPCKSTQKVNIAFMVDATGSMGDEISYLQSELNDVIARTKKSLSGASLKMGSVFYRDHNDEYLVKNFDFTAKVPDVISFLKSKSLMVVAILLKQS
jgi:hypothetical protein